MQLLPLTVGGRLNFPGIDPLLCVWAGRPFPIWPLLPTSTHLEIWSHEFSIRRCGRAFLTTNRNAGLLTQKVDSSESGISVRTLQQDNRCHGGWGHYLTTNLRALVTHCFRVSLCPAHSQGLTVDTHLYSCSCSALAEAQEWEQWQGWDRSSLDEKGNLCPGRQQFSSLSLPRLQGNTSLEILIKEASGCPILLLDSLSHLAAMPSASSQFLHQDVHETDPGNLNKIKS